MKMMKMMKSILTFDDFIDESFVGDSDHYCPKCYKNTDIWRKSDFHCRNCDHSFEESYTLKDVRRIKILNLNINLNN